ncbi:hypothetical protein DFR42_1011130 [Undibacterium pigrum]|uniref:Uncharacterized protein n=1 Tax=Undibacterium pigrum TaxID=401470 RepID=A0A318JGB9_9BURK|nr:hypothetical protein DFR42_1011130 [Undibacterium pigrum]
MPGLHGCIYADLIKHCLRIFISHLVASFPRCRACVQNFLSIKIEGDSKSRLTHERFSFNMPTN